MKTLYHFSVDREIEVEKVTESINEAGEKVSVTKKEKTLVPTKFFIRRPNRPMYDEVEMFYGIRLAECIKKGLLTRSMLVKRLANDGGVMSEPDKEDVNVLYVQLFDKQNEFQRLSTLDNKTDEDKKKAEDLIKEITEIRIKFQEYENRRERLFDNTAESISKSKTMIWWLLNLCYSEDGNKLFFGDGDYENKLSKLDEIEEGEDAFAKKVLERFYLGISFWFVGRAEKQEDFDELIKTYESEKTVDAAKT